MIFDTNHRTSAQIGCLTSQAVTAVIRHYAPSTRQPDKRLTRAEAEALITAGISVGVVHQSGGNSPGAFSAAQGKRDANYAVDYAVNTIGQPSGSTIYFAVDYDAKLTDVTNRIVPYFLAVKEVCARGLDGNSYEVGGYGSGLVLKKLLDDRIITYAWLSQSTGHQGSAAFKASNRWTLFQHLPSTVCSLDVDVDDLNTNAAGFGQFDALNAIGASPAIQIAPPVAPTAVSRYVVSARTGLRLRSGPGTQFDIMRELTPGTALAIVSRVGDWAMVDLGFDGLIDGAVHSAFLRPET